MQTADAEPSTSDVQIGNYYNAKKENGTFDKDNPTISKDQSTEKEEYAEGRVKVDKRITGTNEENVFDVTLKVTTKDVKIETGTSEKLAVVLVIDTSGSMEEKKDDRGNTVSYRLRDVKTAAEKFVDSFIENAGEGSKISVVNFSGQIAGQDIYGNRWGNLTAATTALGWTSANTDNVTAIKAKINGLKAEGGTTLAAGLKLAQNLLNDNAAMEGITNKNIIVLTDGKPTYGVNNLNSEKGMSVVCENGSNLYGNGQDKNTTYFHKIHTQIETLCGKIKAQNIGTYAVFIGEENVQCPGTGEGRQHKDCNNLSLRNGKKAEEWLRNDCKLTTFSVESTDDGALDSIFNRIATIIQLKTQAWELTDPMGEHVEFNSNEKLDAAKGIHFDNRENELTWDLKKIIDTDTDYVTVKESEGSTIRTYTFTYQIKLNNLADTDTFTPNKFYPTNGVTKLTYYIAEAEQQETPSLETAYFNIPSVKGYVGSLSFNKVDDKDKPLSGATFKLTTTDDSDFEAIAKSNDEGKVTFENIPSGHEFTLTETEAPENYQLSSETKTIGISYGKITDASTIKNNNTVVNIPTPPENGSLTITKVINGLVATELPDDYNPIFTITYPDGTTTKTVNWASDNQILTTKSMRIDNLPAGEYTVKEAITSAWVDGYTAEATYSTQDGKVNVVAGQNAEITVTNTYTKNEQPSATGNLTITKEIVGIVATDLPNNYNPEFIIKGSNGETQKKVYWNNGTQGNTATTKSITIQDLPAGEYTVKEAITTAWVDGYTAEDTYSMAGGKVNVVADQNAEIKITNTYTKNGGGYVPTPSPSYDKLTLTKQVVGLDTIPADYEVTVTINNQYGTVRTVTLKANETKTIDLLYGNYTLTETAPAVEGYTQSGQTFSKNNFTLTYGGENVTITNTYTKDAEEPAVDPKPTDPATPVEPNKPDENPNNVPKTGDDMPISLAIYGIIAAGALLGIRKAAKRETK